MILTRVIMPLFLFGLSGWLVRRIYPAAYSPAIWIVCAIILIVVLAINFIRNRD
ncbi:hypothetical protein RZC83_01515 (plasmid) [Klebsiella pneumoniae]|uniref:hypothetical protein n=1 Tax=Klebsiella pneumoniae TaxID=573 RepID=UPI0029597463|nr:hypothetical protein [Escherichia coli]HEE0776221.1 hypothetical protein [Klebsiella pneumoniae]